MTRYRCPLALLSFLLVPLLGAAELLQIEASGPLRLRAGGTVPIPMAARHAALAPSARTATAQTNPANRYNLAIGKRAEGKGFFLAAPVTMKPGAYSVGLSIAASDGAEYQGTVEVVVDPFPPIPHAGFPPVLLINGFDLNSATTGQCALSENSTGTFGQLQALIEADEIPVVFVDNCAFGTLPIESLGSALGEFINGLKSDDGHPVEAVDVVAFSMGGLILRSYLSGKQLEPGVFRPPAIHKVNKAVFVATPHFGSPLVESVAQGTQLPQMRRASRFLWDLATWNQGRDDLRGVDAIAIAGSGGAGGAGDGVIPLTSSSLGPGNLISSAIFGMSPVRTRVLPACHNSTAAPFFCPGGPINIMSVTNADHPTGRIIRDFFTEQNNWRQIGDSLADNTLLAANGAGIVAVQTSSGEYVFDASGVIASGGGDRDTVPDIALTRSADGIFHSDQMPASAYSFRAQFTGGPISVQKEVAAGGRTAAVVKGGPRIALIIPSAGLVDTLNLAAGSLISIFGENLAAATNGDIALPLPTNLSGTSVSVSGAPIGLLFVSPAQINAFLPAGLTGLIAVKVTSPSGSHTINVLIESAVPTLFAIDGSGTGQAAALHAGTADKVTVEKPTAIRNLVSLYGTGLGATMEMGGLQWALIQPTITVGGVPAVVQYAGRAPGFVGLDQINIFIPQGVAPGLAVPVVVTSGTQQANTVTLAIQ